MIGNQRKKDDFLSCFCIMQVSVKRMIFGVNTNADKVFVRTTKNREYGKRGSSLFLVYAIVEKKDNESTPVL
jgi:hypothetical protein